MRVISNTNLSYVTQTNGIFRPFFNRSSWDENSKKL